MMNRVPITYDESSNYYNKQTHYIASTRDALRHMTNQVPITYNESSNYHKQDSQTDSQTHYIQGGVAS